MTDAVEPFKRLQLDLVQAEGAEREHVIAELARIAASSGDQAKDAAEVLRDAGRNADGSVSLPARWRRFDISQRPGPPEWLVRDVIAKRWITLCHGREASGKSMFAQTIIGAALSGSQWLGRNVVMDRILVVDEENPSDVLNQRLKGLGYSHEKHADRLVYFSQIGCQLGRDQWGDDLLKIAANFKPDLVVIDSMLSATTATWDNATILPLFTDIFKPLTRLGCAVLLIHHDRKAGGDIKDRASGGTQWMAQVDRQIAFEAIGKMRETALADGAVRLAFPVKLEGGKSRQGRTFPETYLSIVSDSQPDDADMIRRMWLEVEGKPSEAQKGSWRPTWYAERVEAVLQQKPGLTFNALHKEIGKNRDYLRQAIDALIEDGTVRVEPGARDSQLHYTS